MKKSKLKLWLSVFAAALLILSMFSACSPKKSLSLEVEFEIKEEERVYYIGDEFDSSVAVSDGYVSRIPKIFVVDAKGNKSEDISHSDKVTFTGYDMQTAGKQTVTVAYKDGEKFAETTYEIEVIDQKIIFIEASDPMHLKYGAFKVGEKFTTYGTNENGDAVGVTVVLHMEDSSKPEVSYFTNAPEISGLEVDTSGCELDDSGKFTKPGTFTVRLTYRNFKTTYQIKVEE
ncbi:MAG: bacterial Ig-like domain-containing protein [Clostridiales bacterium]|nr:bacterial Ig-like domain-containing protein [Candidatus Equinaster intestinalis]